MNSRRPIIVAVVLMLMMTAVASGWSTKEHILIARLAAARLLADPQTPEAMKDWLRHVAPGDLSEPALRAFYIETRQGIWPRGVDGVAYWAVVPDLEALVQRSRPVPPFGVHERMLHYLDVEFFDPAQQPIPADTKPLYHPDLSARPRLEDFPRDLADPRYQQAGMLPFRVEQSYNKLVQHLRAGRLDDQPGQFPRDEHAARWAGLLSHYIADNTQPHHSSVDYRSRSYFPADARIPDIHAHFEYKPVDDEYADYPELRLRLWTLLIRKLEEVEDPVGIEDVWAGSVQTTLNSYDALPLIGQAAAAAWKTDGATTQPSDGHFDIEAFYAFEAEWRGKRVSLAELKAEQIALAIHRTAAHWRKAWLEAFPQDPAPSQDAKENAGETPAPQ